MARCGGDIQTNKPSKGAPTLLLALWLCLSSQTEKLEQKLQLVLQWQDHSIPQNQTHCTVYGYDTLHVTNLTRLPSTFYLQNKAGSGGKNDTTHLCITFSTVLTGTVSSCSPCSSQVGALMYSIPAEDIAE